MGPLLLFDKSVLHVLTPPEIEELGMSFLLVGSPTLVREIIADLKKDAPAPGRVPEEMVRALARKMVQAQGAQPANFRKLAMANLGGQHVPMFGQVPVDTSRPNVTITDEGRAMIYDVVPEQRLWQRWADGNFTTRDEDSATAWRSGLQRVNLRALGTAWKDYVRRHFGNPRDIPTLVTAVDKHLSSPRPRTQTELLGILAEFLEMPQARYAPIRTFLEHNIPLTTVAPYAASVLRLYLTFVGAIATHQLGPRPSHYIDLQYLFYTPFCMVFTSNDNLHERLWPATRGVNMYLNATVLKTDLARRRELREQGVQTFEHGYPVRLGNSVITEAMDRFMRMGPLPQKNEGDIKVGQRIDDLPPIDRDRIRNAFRTIDRMPQDEADLL